MNGTSPTIEYISLNFISLFLRNFAIAGTDRAEYTSHHQPAVAQQGNGTYRGCPMESKQEIRGLP
jgi:hypothetical protein